MSVEKINQLYPLATFLINSLNMEVTKEKLQSLFKHLNIEFNPKIAEHFCMSKEQIEELSTSVQQAPVASAPATSASEVQEVKKEEPKKAEEPAEDFDMFGDDLFG